MPLQIVRQDITRMQVDAIVNAANPQLAQGGGVCGAIFTAAGAPQMEQACAALAPIAVGEAVITPGFALPARHVIHTSGPVHSQYSPQRSEQLLRSAYINSLQLAHEQGCASIAFPLISSGIYGYPKEQALQVARDSILEFLQAQDDELDVYLVVFDKSAFQLSQSLLGRVASYIDEHLVEEIEDLHGRFARSRQVIGVTEEPANTEFSRYPRYGSKEWPQPMLELGEPFEVHLLRLIREKNMTEVEVYKRANISRKLFSKIRSGKGYVPGKRTILALAVALELDLEQTVCLLGHAGFALASNQRFDVIIKHFIELRSYNIFEINEVLFQFDQALLGC